MIRVVHILNQFFAGIGGEEKADMAVAVADGAAGAARALQSLLAERGQVVATIYFGDNYFHEHKDDALAAITAELEKHKPDVVVAGP
ncbi:MAG: glycine/betaine/sarcosine/D-proline family reductase selenoprotein B, partial [Candidatus Binatia bacterium]